MKEGLIKDKYEHIIREIQTFITISYILMVGIGMVFTYKMYSEFEINIFQYADIFDFLIAPFEDYFIFIFVLVSALIVLMFVRLDLILAKKFPNFYSKIYFGLDKSPSFLRYKFMSIVLIFVFYVFISADIYGEIKKKEIEKQPIISLRFSDNEIQKGILIGKTKEIIFLLKNGKVKAIPLTSLVKEFEIK